MSNPQARRDVPQLIGNNTNEHSEDGSVKVWWRNSLRDVRYSLRRLARNPLFTATVVITLALGIGANTAIFSVIDAVLLRPLPFPNSERLVALYERLGHGENIPVAPADFLDFRSQTRTLEHVAAFREGNFTITGRDQPERVPGVVATPDFFSVLGVQAQLGRTLLPERDKPGAPSVVVVSYNLWQRRWGGAAAVLGQSANIDGEQRTIVGVMPRGFQFPAGSDVWESARFAVPEHPLKPQVDQSNIRDSHYFDTIGRMRPGVELKEANAEAATIMNRLKQQYGLEEEATATVVDLHDDLFGKTRATLLILMGAVTVLLFIACANVANLLLARGATHQREIAIRGALGGRRTRLVSQLLTESLILGAIGGGLGILLAQSGLRLFTSLIPSDMATLSALKLSIPVLIFTAAVSLTAGTFFGLFPALQLTNPDLNSVMKEGGRSAAGGLRRYRTRSLLVVSEIALASVMLIGAGLLIRSFSHLLAVPEGFNPNKVLTLQLSLPQARYSNPAVRANLAQQVLADVGRLPGVTSAAVVSRLPLTPGGVTRSIEVRGRTAPSAGEVSPDYLVISPDYFQTMGIPLIRGRAFTDHDDAEATPSVIVSQAMANYFWPGQDAIGKFVKIGVCIDWCLVSGLVGDVQQHHLDQPSQPTVYAAYAQDPWQSMAIAVRTATDPASMGPEIEGAIHLVDKDQPVYKVLPMREVVEASLSSQRSRTMLLAAFALLALALAGTGIYGVMAYSVAQRSHDIALRMALGAQRRDVVRLVLLQALRLALAGVGIGLILSVGLLRLMSNVLYGLRTTDAITFPLVAVGLTVLAMFASYIPARRAVRIDPVQALRRG
jgi:putative ABC transport system permease protein